MKNLDLYEIKEQLEQKAEQKVTALRVLLHIASLFVVPTVLVGYIFNHSYSVLASTMLLLLGSVLFCVAGAFAVVITKKLLFFKYLKEAGL